MALRSPIIVTVGHIDHGKTTLLDKIRGTSVTKGEAGLITQHVGASYIPLDAIQKICGELLKKLKIEIKVPSLLFVDTPGHAAFVSLRKRGGAVSDLAVLVIDINEGFQEQTDESLKRLNVYMALIVVAAMNIDMLQGWFPNKDSCFLDSFQKQREDVKEELDKKIYNLVIQLSERGFNSERFDRIEDFTKKIAIVPCSGTTGEGIPELIVMLAGLSQQFLKERLNLSDVAKGTVLEVKEVKGLGTTIDVILYDGIIKKSDYLIIGGKEPIVTKIKALLRPRPLQELRVEKQFEQMDEVSAAAGIKISAPNLEQVIAGSPIIAVSSENEIEEAKKIIQKEVEEVQFTKAIDGIIVKADTLGSLEALIKLLIQEDIPIRKADVGNITKEDIVEAQNITDELKKVILVFNLKIPEETKTIAKDLGIKIFENQVIYRLIEEYKEWCWQKKERDLQEKLERVIRPAEIKILKGYVFRVSNPAVFGIEVLKGVLKTGALMGKKDGKIIGKVKEIQREGKNITEAKAGDKVAISMEEPTIGRQIKEGDILVTIISDSDRKILNSIISKLTEDERELLELLT
ncbi:MAG: translation initiation factor IF-2 [Candidatus Aenigmatarchaeota archaeon]